MRPLSVSSGFISTFQVENHEAVELLSALVMEGLKTDTVTDRCLPEKEGRERHPMLM